MDLQSSFSSVVCRRPASRRILLLAAASAALLAPGQAWAQRAGENAVTAASDGFGASVGNERVGIYTTSNVRGFSPILAGNRRLEGLYFDFGGYGVLNRVTATTTVRVGLPALAYPFPAPSGIVDYTLKPSGDDPGVSLVAGRSQFGGVFVELDARGPIVEGRLTGMAALAVADETYSDGRNGLIQSAALAPTLRFARGSLTAYWGGAWVEDDTQALMITRGPRLPPAFKGGDFKGQAWARNDQESHTYGALTTVRLTDAWTVRAGAFESRSNRSTYTDLFLDVQPDGSARNVMIYDPDLPARWTSGEARLIWRGDGAELDHTIQLSVRARDKRWEIGGGGSGELGAAWVGRLTPAARPGFVAGEPTVSEVTQTTLGAAWLGRWRDRLEFNLGLQKTRYRSVLIQGGIPAETRDDPWLYNAAVAWTPTPALAFYAGVTTGLEETPGPPANAVNRNDAVAASRTEQRDGGVRVALGNVRLVAGVFEIERPYFSLDAAGRYGELGSVRHRGAEFSVVGPITERLSVVGGLVLMDAEVRGEAVDSGRVGPRPVASTTTRGRIDLEYRAPAVEGLSLTLGVQHTGAVVASTGRHAELDGEQLEIPSFTTVDLGARYRFQVAGAPMTVRAVLANVFDDQGFQTSSSQTFTLRDTRRFSLQLSADF